MQDSLESYTAFSLMMQHRNFSAVARKMGVAQSTVSKQIASLEETFKVQLFVRNTRRVSPTLEANLLNEKVENLLEALEIVRASALGQTPDLDGQLSLLVPADFGRSVIMPLVPQFLESHPALSLQVEMVDGSVEPAFDRQDLTITAISPKSNTSLIKRTLRTYARQVVATPAYISEWGMPESPLDLESHAVMAGFDVSGTAVEFDSDEGRQRIAINGVIATNDLPTIFDFALASRAIAVLPSWFTNDAVSDGRLVQLLRDYYLPPLEMAIVYPPTSFLSRRARLFIDFLVAKLAAR